MHYLSIVTERFTWYHFCTSLGDYFSQNFTVTHHFFKTKLKAMEERKYNITEAKKH